MVLNRIGICFLDRPNPRRQIDLAVRMERCGYKSVWVRETPTDLVEVAQSIGLTGRLALFRHVVLPSSVPFVMAGFRLGIGRAVVGMAIAEVFLRLGGIGALIVENGARFRTAHVIAAIVPLPLLGIALTKAAGRFEQRIQYWRYTAVSE